MKIVYWMNPIVIMACWAIICLISLSLSPEAYYLLMRSRKVIEPQHAIIALAAISIFCLFFTIGNFSVSGRFATRDDLERKLSKVFSSRLFVRVCAAFFLLTLIAYAIWFGPTLNISTIIRFFSGNLGEREVGLQISGVTTMTQFGVALSSVATLGAIYSTSESYRKTYKLILAGILFFALYRSFFWSERLALIECFVASISAFSLASYKGQRLYLILPIALVVMVIGFFGTAEYFRSWSFYSQFDIDVVSFSVSRFLSYYISSFNNLALLIDHIDPSHQPINTLKFFYLLPLPGLESLRIENEALWEGYVASLSRYANPEFNLFTGIGMTISDFGVTGGVMALSVHGFITGRLYKLAKLGRLTGLFFYPVWMVGLLEFGRLLYWGNTRAFPAWVLLFVLSYLAKRIAVSRVV